MVNLVCRYWRQAAIGAKDLWTHIPTVSYAKDLGQLCLVFELFVKRSASLPLTLTVPRTDDWEHSSSTPNPMESHVHRLQTLTIGCPEIDPSDFRFFSKPAPLLEELKIVCCSNLKTLPMVFRGSALPLRMLDVMG